MSNIGNNIKSLRIQKNMTQDELAEKLFVTRQTVSNYETGRSRPDVEMLLRISDVLGVDMQELLYEPVSAAVRKRRIAIVLGIGLCCLFLGFLVNRGIALSNEYAMQTYHLIPNLIMGLFVRPMYFLLLGVSAAACMRLLIILRPLSPRLGRWIRWSAVGFLTFYLLGLLPWVFASIRFPRFWFLLCNCLGRVVKHHFWIFLIPGFAMGFGCKNSL